MGAADTTLEGRDGAYPRGILLRSLIPRPIEASDVGSKCQVDPRVSLYLEGWLSQSGIVSHFAPDYSSPYPRTTRTVYKRVTKAMKKKASQKFSEFMKSLNSVHTL